MKRFWVELVRVSAPVLLFVSVSHAGGGYVGIYSDSLVPRHAPWSHP
jgi:hypothetical protein